MFIAVGRYKDSSEVFDMINVLDTKDCKVEAVDTNTLFKSGVAVENILYVRMGDSIVARLCNIGIKNVLNSVEIKSKSFQYDKNMGTFKACNTRFQVIDDTACSINGVKLKSAKPMLLSYIFHWRSCIVLRFIEKALNADTSSCHWYTVVIEQGSGDILAEWSEDYNGICTDREIARKVESFGRLRCI